MIKQILNYNNNFLKSLARWEREHPYRFSSILSIMAASFLFFYSPSINLPDDQLFQSDDIKILDLDTVRAPKRITRKNISTDTGEIVEDNAQAERATGISDDENAVDISYYPNIAPPRLVGRLKKRYPKIAREMNIEAIVIVELLIGFNGKVKNVGIIGVRLLKELPQDLKSKISRKFIRDAKLMLLGAQYSPPVVDGKKAPIRMEERLKFILD